mgnify:CR=1 FL=1
MLNGRWYLTQTHPQRERVTRDGLSRRGFRSLFPLVQFRGHPPKSLFSRYVFVFLDDDSPWFGHIWNVHGVTRLIGGENPTPVQAGWVERLLPHLVNDTLLLDSPSDFLKFVPGDRISIIQGIFAGQGGICVWSTVSSIVVELMTSSVVRRIRLPVSAVSHPGNVVVSEEAAIRERIY